MFYITESRHGALGTASCNLTILPTEYSRKREAESAARRMNKENHGTGLVYFIHEPDSVVRNPKW